MARRRYQAPKPFKRGKWWNLLLWKDAIVGGKPKRIRVWHKLAPSTMAVREVRKIADELTRPLNQGLETVGSSATTFGHYVEANYEPLEMPLLASSTQARYSSVIKKYLLPAFGAMPLRELTPATLQSYFSSMANTSLSHESKDKVRDVLASVLKSCMKYGLLVTNPLENVKLPPQRRGKRQSKPYITKAQFDLLVELIPEPYATMVLVAVMTGLRVSELLALRWEDVHADSITIDERFCRGDWGCPKSDASNATVAVNPEVIARIQALKGMTVAVRWGGQGAVKHIKVVKSDAPDALVFQSLKGGSAMNESNILRRHIKPAAEKLNLGTVNWLVLRRSFATFLKMAGVDVKDAQALMRHSRATTTLDIYQQFVPESQRSAVNKLSTLQ